MKRTFLRAATFLLTMAGFSGGATATEPVTGFDHAEWGEVLAGSVKDDGMVDYRGIEASRAQLDLYLEKIHTISPVNYPKLFPDPAHSLAYYLNAYNALVFEGVLNLPPERDTVWGMTGTGAGFFVVRRYLVGGERMSLNKLENEIVRSQFRDPRIHAALNCASRGCPRLPQEPFDGLTLDAQLDAAMIEFINQERNCRYDPESRTLTLSKIFDWFRSDFESFEADQEADQERNAGTLIDYLNRYRSGDSIPAAAEIVFSKYDKRLNRWEPNR